MALPTTINQETAKFRHVAGPYISSAGNVYVLTLGSSGGTRNILHLEKATDPTSSFTSVANTNMGASNTTEVLALASTQDGDDVWVTGEDDFGEVTLLLADLSADTLTLKTNIFESNTHYVESVDIGVRSDGDIVVAYQGAGFSSMGKQYSRVWVRSSTDGGSTWGTAYGVTPADTAEAHTLVGACMGASDRFHIFYVVSTSVADSLDLEMRTFSSTDSVGSASVIDTTLIGSGSPNRFEMNAISALAWDNGTNDMMGLTYADADGKASFARSVDDGTPSWTIDTAITATVSVWPFTPNSSDLNVYYTELAYDSVNDDLYCLLLTDADDDLDYHVSGDGGDTWGSATDIHTSTVYNFCSNIFTRSGNVRLAVLISEGTQHKYDEVDLGSASSALPLALDHKAAGSALYEPTVVKRKTLSLDYKASESALYEPDLKLIVTGHAVLYEPTLSLVTAGTGSEAQLYNGSTWVAATVEVYNGSSWVAATPQLYTGSSWN